MYTDNRKVGGGGVSLGDWGVDLEGGNSCWSQTHSAPWTADMDLNSSQVEFTALNLICSLVVLRSNLLELWVKVQAKEAIHHRKAACGENDE